MVQVSTFCTFDEVLSDLIPTTNKKSEQDSWIK